MRTIALMLLGAGLVAAADAAKPPAAAPVKPSPLRTAERMALSKLIADRGEIEKQITAIIAEGCEARGLDSARCKLRDDGTFIETPKEPANAKQ
jgi:hypothetical protein